MGETGHCYVRPTFKYIEIIVSLYVHDSQECPIPPERTFDLATSHAVMKIRVFR